MINQTFDNHSDAIISPENIYGKRDAVCDICILTFSHSVIESVKKTFACEEICCINSANGTIPIYLLDYKGKKIAFYMSMIGSSCAGNCLEEARCLIGAKKYIMFGSCGCLQKEITAGKLIVPTAAYRDEGLSYHYAEAADYISITHSNIVADFLIQSKIPFVEGKTWTTDALFRETRSNMEKRKAEGCIAVEMECAGLQAVCDFRGLDFYPFFFSGDLLDSDEWESRILGGDTESNHQLQNFYIALELAQFISDMQ